LKVLAIKAFLRLCSWLPLSVLHRLGTMAGYLMAWFATDARRITEVNLRLCFPQLSEVERGRLVRESLIETACTAFELGLIWVAPAPRALGSIVKITGEHVLQTAREKGKGVIIIAPHLGSWELSGLYLANRGAITSLYKPPRLDGLQTFMTDVRGRNGATLVPTNRKGVALLFKALERGEMIGILPDQEPPLDGGVFAPFFGTPALTMTLVSKLAARTGAPVVSIFAKRLPGSAGFEIILANAHADVAHSDIHVASAALNQSVMECVQQAPAQYQWEYRRFKHQPDHSKNALYRQKMQGVS